MRGNRSGCGLGLLLIAVIVVASLVGHCNSQPARAQEPVATALAPVATPENKWLVYQPLVVK